MKKNAELTTESEAEEVTLEGMRLTKVGRGQYLAHSMSKPEVAYMVDVSHYGGLGSCTCVDFVARRKPRWSEVRKPRDTFRCKHIRRVRNYILDAIIGYYAKQPRRAGEAD